MFRSILAAQALIPGGMKATMNPGIPLPNSYLTVNLLGAWLRGA